MIASIFLLLVFASSIGYASYPSEAYWNRSDECAGSIQSTKLFQAFSMAARWPPPRSIDCQVKGEAEGNAGPNPRFCNAFINNPDTNAPWPAVNISLPCCYTANYRSRLPWPLNHFVRINNEGKM